MEKFEVACLTSPKTENSFAIKTSTPPSASPSMGRDGCNSQTEDKMKKRKTDMDDQKVDEIVCEVLDYCGGIGIWNQVTAHMLEVGYSDEEFNEAMDAFSKRCGRG